MHKLRSSFSALFHYRHRWLQCTLGNKFKTREYSTPTSSQPTNPYPYPTHRNPTPHQIFHLPHSATENDVKARYFDLVRIYHPDKASTTVSPEVAHERFQAITTAYDILRGKKPYPGASSSSSSSVEDRSYQTTAAYRAARRRRQELYSSGAVDDRWKDRIFMGLAVATVGVFVFQTLTTRRDAMADIMTNSRRPTSYPDQVPRKPSEDEKRLSA
ncbi:hypothetical protein AN958_03536 [Leucoagaricus sp. SymC.cos]|nr:hypothetical protein AN958_03536 [Leucoagaricus sp. SymC.cos]